MHTSLHFHDAVSGSTSGAVGATSLITPSGVVRGHGPWPREMADHAVAWEDGIITYVGPATELPGDELEWFQDCTIGPGFVDCHTHLPFVGWRADEFDARLAGASYRDLHGEGGIDRSARLFADASDDEVLAFCRPLVQEMADHGTTTLELKTGYGLSVEAELRQVRLARRLAEEAPQTCVVTLLACHAVPVDTERRDWVRAVCEELIPAVARDRLADAVDVYVEDIAFTLEDLNDVARAASEHGLPMRCHADQLGASGAAEVAVALGARSADHLNHVSKAGISALGATDSTVAVLLPTSTLFLRASPPDARALIDAGATVAFATDCNPGTSPVVSVPEVIAIGCSMYGLAPAEALAATTVNAAAALGLAGRGTLAVGAPADLVILDGDAFRQVPYRPGHNPVLHTFANGKRVGGR
jgi:imidazolonepropionase